LSNAIELTCLRGLSGDRAVLIGSAPAKALATASFADILDESTGRGYQRRLNAQHSLDFRRYIQRTGSTTIPLTFNLRHADGNQWRLDDIGSGLARLTIGAGAKALAQVDCQHRLGHLADLCVPLPFMIFLHLTEREEVEVFGVINGKAKGLSTSLLDFHQVTLCEDLARDRPEIYLALLLRNEPSSPWHRQLDLGGTSVSGMARRASLRTMQKALKRLVAPALKRADGDIDGASALALDFWKAVTTVLPAQWAAPRRHMLTKGVGVYALTQIAADLVSEMPKGVSSARQHFESSLFDFAPLFDWSTTGPLSGLGGESGVASAVALLRSARQRPTLRLAHG
jgi:DGQHR domain-containing protein